MKELVEKLEKLTGKKVILEADGDTHGLDPEKKFYHGKTNQEFISALNALKGVMTPEGFEIVKNFTKGAAGINRFGIVGNLLNLFKGKIESISKSHLRSYGNTQLFELLNTGDLIEVSRGKLVPVRRSSNSVDQALKNALKQLSINPTYSDQIIAELKKQGYEIKG